MPHPSSSISSQTLLCIRKGKWSCGDLPCSPSSCIEHFPSYHYLYCWCTSSTDQALWKITSVHCTPALNSCAFTASWSWPIALRYLPVSRVWYDSLEYLKKNSCLIQALAFLAVEVNSSDCCLGCLPLGKGPAYLDRNWAGPYLLTLTCLLPGLQSLLRRQSRRPRGLTQDSQQSQEGSIELSSSQTPRRELGKH